MPLRLSGALSNTSSPQVSFRSRPIQVRGLLGDASLDAASGFNATKALHDATDYALGMVRHVLTDAARPLSEAITLSSGTSRSSSHMTSRLRHGKTKLGYGARCQRNRSVCRSVLVSRLTG